MNYYKRIKKFCLLQDRISIKKHLAYFRQSIFSCWFKVHLNNIHILFKIVRAGQARGEKFLLPSVTHF